MSTPALLADLESRGIRLTATGPDRLHVDAPKGVLTPDLLDRLRLHKAALLSILAATPCTIPHDNEPSGTARQGIALAEPPPERPGYVAVVVLRDGVPTWVERRADAADKAVRLYAGGQIEAVRLGISVEAAPGVPSGWSADGWRRRLLYLADACAAMHPARAVELRRAAAEIGGEQ